MSSTIVSEVRPVVHRFMLITGNEGYLDQPRFFESHRDAFMTMLTELAYEVGVEVEELIEEAKKNDCSDGSTYSFSRFGASYCRGLYRWSIFCIAVDPVSLCPYAVENWPDDDVAPELYGE